MSESLAGQLDQQLRLAGLPVIGVSLGSDGDKATWRVDLEKGATAAHKTQAQQIVTAFVPSAVVDHPPLDAEAVLAWCATKLGVDVVTATLEVVSGVAVKG